MLSEVQRRKFIRLFHVLDADHNGALEWRDYEQLLAGLASALTLTEDSDQYRRIQAVFAAQWQELQGQADTNGDGNVTLDEWLDFHDALVTDPERYHTFVGAFVQDLYTLLDRDGDGRLTFDELALCYEACGVPDGGAWAWIFARLDARGEGSLTGDDLAARVHEFFHAQDDRAPGNWFLGLF